MVSVTTESAAKNDFASETYPNPKTGKAAVGLPSGEVRSTSIQWISF